ncbi:MAG TPA: RdgB/HAM1 family non-canonical purine NTP pyrophosphatase [Candidatus Polarisedimenticolaceae bacterium]|nr:RdgB/HAM1 family non-canonical purine NTP pyrophosphatase [Candidatus Polarisedimenticolaceae bacterium]
MPTLVLASGNPGKVAELAQALKEKFTVDGLQSLSDRTPVVETGDTFEANARLKAEEYSRRTPHLVVADDSGLEVDALGGRPGVLSARYGGPGLDDPARCRALLHELDGTADPARTARFRCVLAVARGGATLATYHGVVEGLILRAPRGTNGFGYDPVFFHPPSGRAFAELSRHEKEKVSHRGAALRQLVAAVSRGEVA